MSDQTASAPEPSGPETPEPEDRETIDRLMREERLRLYVRDQLAANRPEPRGLGALLTDRETIRLFLGALVIPAVVWLAGTAWQGVVAARNAPGLTQANATAKAAQNLADDRADIAQMTSLVPFLIQPGPQAQIATEILGSLARARPKSPYVGAVLQAAQQAITAQRDAAPPGDKAAAARQLEALAVNAPPADARQAAPPGQALTSIAPAIAANAEASRPGTVYLQVYGASQLAEAAHLREALRALGIPVPGIENVTTAQGTDAARLSAVRQYAQRGTSAVRYYSAGDEAAAAYTAAIVQRLLPQYGTPQLQDLSSRKQRAAPGVIEVWLPCGAQEGCT